MPVIQPKQYEVSQTHSHNNSYLPKMITSIHPGSSCSSCPVLSYTNMHFAEQKFPYIWNETSYADRPDHGSIVILEQ